MNSTSSRDLSGSSAQPDQQPDQQPVQQPSPQDAPLEHDPNLSPFVWSWPQIRLMAKRAVLYLTLSILAHAALLIAMVLIDFSTYIGSVRMPWSDRDLSGIGMAADPEAGTETFDGDPVARLTPLTPPEVVVQKKTEPTTLTKPPDPNLPETPDGTATPNTDPQQDPQNPKPPDPTQPDPSTPTPATNPNKPPDDPNKKPSTSPDGKGTHPGETLPGLAAFGPGNVRVIFVIRSDRLRGTDYEDTMRGLLKRFPDYQVTLRNSGLDPIDDFDVMLVASNNLNKLEQTFVAIRYQMTDAKLMELFSKNYIVPITWTEHLGRPRGIPDPQSRLGIRARDVFIPEPGLALLIQTTLIDSLGSTVAKIENPDGSITERSWLQTLSAIQDIDALTGSNPAVFMSVKDLDISFNIKLPRMPKIVGITASITTDAAPLLTLKLEFNSDADAQTFLDTWPIFVKELVGLSPMLIGLQGSLDGLKFEQRGQALYGQTTFSGFLIKLGLDRFRTELPEVYP